MSPEREIKMFGCTEAELKSEVDQWCERGGRPSMMVMSMLSDVQELLLYAVQPGANTVYADDARQTANRAKWIIQNYW